MKLTRRSWLRSLARVAGCAVTMWLAGMAAARAQAVSTTAVQGTVYLANGQPAGGTLVVSWPTFTTSAGQLISAGQTTVTVGADGFVSVNLAPNQGATPAGEYYTAVFYNSDGTVTTQYWLVPEAAQASLAQVQAQVMPAAQAVQAVSKSYVDQAVAQALGNQLSASGGDLTGPLYLNSDPTQPLQAADKHYVDSNFSAALPLSGGTITGPASFNAAVTFGSSVTATSGIGFSGTGAAQTLANLLPGAASNGANGMTLSGAVAAASVNGVWDLKTKFGAVGSNETMGCTAAASSYTLSSCSGGDFVTGEYVFLPFAGVSPTISTPSAPAVSCGADNGGSCTGSTVYSYEIVAVQSGYVNAPMTAPSPSTSVTQATQTAQTPVHNSAVDIYTNVSWTAVTGSIGYAIYKSVNSGPYNFYEVVPSGTTSIKDFNHAQSAQFTCTDMGYPCVAPSAATPSGVFAQIASVSGSTVVLQARSIQPADPSQPGINGSVTVQHDDSPAFYALAVAAAANAGGQIQVHIPAGNYMVHPYNQPPGSSTSRYAVMMLDGLSNLTINGDGERVTNIYVEPSSPQQFGDITGEFIDGVSGYGNSCGASFGGSGAGYAISDPALVGSMQVTLSTPANSSHFSAGGYVSVYNNASGYPWEYYGELNKVLAVNSTTGVLTLAYPLTKTYSASLPAPYSSCSSCNAAPVIAPAIACSVGIALQNMTVRGPVMFANIETVDGFTLNHMDIQVLNTFLGGELRHVYTENSKILEDPWSPDVSSLGLISAAAGSADEIAQANTYKNPHLGPVGWQQCSEGAANITDQDNTYQLSGSADQNSPPNSMLFETPECFNYTMQGDTVNISNTNLLGVFGGDFSVSGASGAIKDNTVSVDSVGNTTQASVGSAIGFGGGFSTPYIAVDNNKWVTPASQYSNLGPVTANANDLIGNYRSIALTEASNSVNFGATYGSSNVYAVSLTQNLFSVVFGSTRVAGYKFDLIFTQPSTGTPAAFYTDITCNNSYWNTGGNGVDCQNNPPPTVPFLLGASVITHWFDDGTTLHYLGENFRNPRLTTYTMSAQSGAVTMPTYLGYQMTIVPMSGNITSVNTGYYRQSTGTGYFYGIAFQQPSSGGPYTLPSTCAEAQWNDGNIDFQGGVCPVANPAAGSTTTIWFWFDGANSHEVSRSYWAPGTGPSGTNITGTAMLAAGTVTVPTPSACAISASCTYQFTHCGAGGTEGVLSVGTVTAGTSFVVNSSSSTDTSQVCWTILP